MTSKPCPASCDVCPEPDWQALGARLGQIETGMIHDERSELHGDEFHGEALRRLLGHVGSGFETSAHLDHVVAAHTAVDRANLKRAEQELRDARAQYRAAEHARTRARQLEELAADMLSRFVRTSDGHRARVGQVQVGRWQATLDAGPARSAQPRDEPSPPWSDPDDHD